ncbi:ATP-binding protein [Spirosoma sp. RP8]|uniref:histidine kinase n=1 Tax=Spirosoma liriopis TaxID=2937440 RepID=A0ABT0HV45_9BACT|nr:ATP-binding protein [Spirosoma liriopis]MCK8495380.1 ATP-binding protein [Spirosoma liriopis]
MSLLCFVTSFRLSKQTGLLCWLIGLFGLSFSHAQKLPQPELITDRQGLPQSFVPSVVQDQTGFIWVATRDGLCRYDGQHFRVFQPDPDGHPSISFTGLEDLFLDYRGRLWITSERGDIDIFDPKRETFTNFSRSAFYRKAIGSRWLYRFYVDRRERLWVGFQAEGIVCFDLRSKRTRFFKHQPDQPRSLRSDSIMQIGEAANGTIWVATRGGLERFDEKTESFTHYVHQVNQPNSLPDNQLCGFQLRPNGEILTVSQRFVGRLNPTTGQVKAYPLPIYNPEWWDCLTTMDAHGTMYFNQNNVLYRFTDQQGPVIVDQRNHITDQCASLFVDRSQVLWVGTNGAGIRKYDLRAAAFRAEPYAVNFYNDVLSTHWLDVPADQLPTPADLRGLNSYNFRYTIAQNRYLWCNIASSDVYRIDLRAKQSRKFPLPVSFYEGDNIDAIPCPLATDPTNQVWATYRHFVWTFDEEQQKWVTQPYRIPVKPTFHVLSFVVDEQALWLATKEAGLWRLDRKTGKMTQYANQPRNARSLSSNALFCLSEDPQDPSRLWIGTFGSGLCLFDKRSGTCQRIGQQDGLPNNVIYSAIPDHRGYLWMGTNKGICRLDRRTLATKTFTRADGLLADEFNRFHWLHLPNDRIIMGGLEGITAFYPHQVSNDTFKPSVELTSLYINNQPLSGNRLYSLPIQTLSRLTLPYDQNFITAEFAALQYNRLGKNRYRYRLEGLETSWKETDRPVATYTNLPPDDYVLVLTATNTSGQWSPQERRLAIRIQPPLWQTWWAYLLYGLTALGLGIASIRVYGNRLRLQQSLALQRREIALKQQEAEQLKAVNELKSNFFANITHEFRTPLTLILGPAERLSQRWHGPDDQAQLATIDRNANQLLGLVNQLLDLSKLEAGALPVVAVRSDLGPFVEQIAQQFKALADEKAIRLTVQMTGLATTYWFDADKLERILYNLLGNAIKFTDRGEVTVQLKGAEQGIELTVFDTGSGIPAHKLPHIFDRFYQADQTSTRSHSGTGIGLALVSELVSLQNGSIQVDSEVGQGTSFTIRLPYRSADRPDETMPKSPTIGEYTDVEPPTSANQPLLLLVEDNADLTQFIRQSLSSDYRIFHCANGQAGLELALTEQPDLVLSDVLMPIMDGYALCRALKTNVQTSHIPVILLTAKSTREDRLEGLTLGADDYLTKPFHVAELQLRVRNQLDTQRRLRVRVQTELSQPTTGPISDQPAIEIDPFLTRLYKILDTHLEDSAFSIEQLSVQVGMSRMSLYRKIKALTGLSPADVIRLYRLKRATELLQQGLGVAETAWRVGFETASHFGKVFREQYQMTPRQFAQQASPIKP